MAITGDQHHVKSYGENLGIQQEQLFNMARMTVCRDDTEQSLVLSNGIILDTTIRENALNNSDGHYSRFFKESQWSQVINSHDKIEKVSIDSNSYV
jgi:hypothetical protein